LSAGVNSTQSVIYHDADFELQVTIVECLFRLTSDSERNALALQWFQNNPPLLSSFKIIREGFFEVVSKYHFCERDQRVSEALSGILIRILGYTL